MNDQNQYGFMPPMNQGCACNKNNKIINERIDNLEKKVRLLERKVSMLETNNIYPNYPAMPYNQDFSNNYRI